MPVILRHVLVIVGYALASELNGRLSLPPLHAAPIWVPAGLAFGVIMLGGVRYAPALAAGGALSMAVRAAHASEPVQVGGTGASVVAVVAALTLVGIAVAGHAVLARFLAERFVRDRTLDSPASALGYLALVGPVACLLSAALGVAGLWVLGLVESSGIAGAALTWWIGDAAGTLACVPVLLAIDPSTRESWRGRIGTLASASTIVVASLVVTHVLVGRLESQRIESRFQSLVLAEGRAVDHRFDEYAEAVAQVTGTIDVDTSSARTRTRFDQAANRLLDDLPDGSVIQLIEEQHFDVVPIYRVRFAAPTFEEIELAREDPAGDPGWRAALARARDSGVVARTFVRRRGDTHHVSLLHPMYEDGEVPTDRDARRKRFFGVVVASIPVEDLFRSMRGDADQFHVVAVDTAAADGEARRIIALPESENLLVGPSDDPPEDAELHSALFTVRDVVYLGQRPIVLWHAPTPEYVAGQTLLGATLPLGLVTVLLPLVVSALLLVVSGQSERLRRTVAVRTSELEDIVLHHRRLVEALDVAIIEFDDVGVITYVNRGWTRTFEAVDTIDPVGLKLEAFIHEDRRGDVADAIARVVADRSGTDVEVPLATPLEADECWVRLRFRPLRDGRGSGGVATAVDASERTSADRARARFVSLVSHEFRSPVTVISGAVQTIEQRELDQLPQLARELLPAMHGASARLARLIDNLMMAAEVDAGELTLSPSTFDLRDLMRSAVEELRPTIDEQSLTITVQAAQQPVSVVVDERLVRLVISNLLSNAVRFTQPGGMITASVTTDGTDVAMLQVRDDGIGIAPEEQLDLFNGFDRVRSGSNTSTGAGLGLGICRAIVEAHGGTIELASMTGMGSTFSVRLPLDDIDDADDHADLLDALDS